MTASSESWSPRLDTRRAVTGAAAGIVLFAIAWGLLHVGFWDDGQIIDTPVYENYGERMLAGEIPYRDFDVEYPPAALPVFAAPALGSPGDYDVLFGALMLACGAAAVALVAVALVALGASPVRLYAGLALTALAPLLLGSVILTRYDLWPAALTAAALAALVAGRDRLGLAALGLASAAKLYPLVLLPVALVYIGKRGGARAAVAGLAAFALVVAATVVPFALIAPGGLAESFERQAGRPLQIESLGSSLLLAAHQLGIYDASEATSHGSQNLVGSLPDMLATASTVLQALALVALYAVFARARPDRERLVAASAAAVTAFIALGKVLSPQFLIWLIPLVPLVGGTVGAGAIFAGALVVTQLWFPTRYWDVVAFEPVGWLVLVRNVALVALFAVLLEVIRRGRGQARSA